METTVDIAVRFVSSGDVVLGKENPFSNAINNLSSSVTTGDSKIIFPIVFSFLALFVFFIIYYLSKRKSTLKPSMPSDTESAGYSSSFGKILSCVSKHKVITSCLVVFILASLSCTILRSDNYALAGNINDDVKLVASDVEAVVDDVSGPVKFNPGKITNYGSKDASIIGMKVDKCYNIDDKEIDWTISTGSRILFDSSNSDFGNTKFFNNELFVSRDGGEIVFDVSVDSLDAQTLNTLLNKDALHISFTLCEAYQVDFDTCQHGDNPQSQIVQQNSLLQKPQDPKWGNSQFCGWYIDKTYQTPWDFEKDRVIQDIVLYAKWTDSITVEQYPSKDLVYNSSSQQLGYVKTYPSDCLIEYSLDNIVYSQNLPAAINAGNYTVYYKANKSGYKESVGCFEACIQKALPKIEITPESAIYKIGQESSFSYTYSADGENTLTCVSDDEKIAQAQIDQDYHLVKISPKSIGSCNIVLKSPESDNFQYSEATHYATVYDSVIHVKTYPAEDLVYTGTEQCLGYVSTIPQDCTIQYSLDGSVFFDQKPCAVDANDYKIYYKVSKDGYDTVDGTFDVKISKKMPSMSIEPQRATYKIPETGNFSYTYDGDGDVVAQSVDTSIADVSVRKIDHCVDVFPVNEGNVEIKLSAPETKNCFGVSNIHYASVELGQITTQVHASEDLEYNSSNQVLGYVEAFPQDCTIQYSVNDQPYSTTRPIACDAGLYRINYLVTKAGYKEVKDYFEVNVAKKQPQLILEQQSSTLFYSDIGKFVYHYDGDGSINATSSDLNVAISKVLFDINTVEVTPKGVGSTEIIVSASGGRNYLDVSVSHELSILPSKLNVYQYPSYNLTYNKSYQLLGFVTVDVDNCNIEYSFDNDSYSYDKPYGIDAGQYQVYYKVEKYGYSTVCGNFEISISKADPTLKLSEYQLDYQVPIEKSFLYTYDGDGEVTVQSSDENFAQVRTEGNSVIVTPKSHGTVNINIEALSTSNYNKVSSIHVANIINGSISVEQHPANGLTYCATTMPLGYVTTFPKECKIEYQVGDQPYQESLPYGKQAGDYVVKYRCALFGYDTVEGSFSTKISQREAGLSLSPTYSSYKIGEQGSFDYNFSAESEITCKVGDESVLTANIDKVNNKVYVTPLKKGSTSITLSSPNTDNFMKGEAVQTAIVVENDLIVDVFPATNLEYNGFAQKLGYVTCDQKDAKIWYKINEQEYQDEIPTAINAEQYCIYYKVMKDGYNIVENHFDVSIAKAKPVLYIDPVSKDYVVPVTGTVDIEYIGDSTISVTSSDDSVAQASLVNNNQIVVTPINKGHAIITVKCGEGNNYLSSFVEHSVYVGLGTIEATPHYQESLVYNKESQLLGKITTTPENCSIQYCINAGEYTESLPYAIDADNYVVGYKASKIGYKDCVGYFEVPIEKSASSLVLKPDKNSYTIPNDGQFSYQFDGDGTLYIENSPENYVNTSLDTISKTVTITPLREGDVDICLIASDGKNYYGNSAIHQAKIYNGAISAYEHTEEGLVYDSTAQILGHVVASIDGCSIEYAVDGGQYSSNLPSAIDAGKHIVDYTIEKEGYNKCSGSFSVEIAKADPKLIVEPEYKSYCVPNSEEIQFSYVGDGKISVESDNENVAKANIVNSFGKINVEPIGSGEANITVHVSDEKNYFGADVVHKAYVSNGQINVEQHPYTNLIYDTKDQTLGYVTANPLSCNIKYSLDGVEWSSKLPHAVNAGNYTVDYIVEKLGYDSVEGSFNVSIDKANPSLKVSSESASFQVPDVGNLIFTYDGDGEVVAKSSDPSIASITQHENSIDVETHKSGNVTVELTSSQTRNYYSSFVKCDITVAPGDIKIVEQPGENLEYLATALPLGKVETEPKNCKVVYSINDGEYYEDEPLAKNAGKYKVKYLASYDGYNDKTGEFECEIAKRDTKLTISSSEKTYIYNESDSFDFACDSDVNIACSVSDENIIKASIDSVNKKIIVKPLAVGETFITLSAPSTDNFKPAQVVQTAKVINNGGLVVDVHPESGLVYSGEEQVLGHVSASQDGCNIEYSLDSWKTTTDSPKAKDSGKYSVSYKVSKYGFDDVSGDFIVSISKAQPILALDPDIKDYFIPDIVNFKVDYNGDGQIDVDVVDQNIARATYDSDSKEVSVEPLSEGIVSIIISAKVGKNFLSSSSTHTAYVNAGTIDVSIFPARGLSYNGSQQDLGYVSADPDNCQISYSVNGGSYTTDRPTAINAGSYVVSFKVSKIGYNDVYGNFSVDITKKQSVLKIDPPAQDYIFPDSGQFNYQFEGDGEITAISENESIAKATLLPDRNSVSVTPVSEGSTKVFLNVSEGKNYSSASTFHYATIQNGTIDCEEHPAGSLDYNAKSQNLGFVATTIKDSLIEYRVNSAAFSTEPPTGIDSGEYHVEYRITKAGYNTVEGNFNVVIQKANPTLLLEPQSKEYTVPQSVGLAYKYNGDSNLSVCSSDNNVCKCEIDNASKHVIVYPLSQGQATITLTADTGKNYFGARAEHTAIVKNGQLDYKVNKKDDLIYNSELQDLGDVSVEKPSGCAIEYKVDDGEYSQEVPKAKDAGKHIVSFRISKTGYDTVSGSFEVNIAKATPKLAFVNNIGQYYLNCDNEVEYVYDGEGQLELVCDDGSKAQVYKSDNKFYIKSKIVSTSGLTLKSSETNNYYSAKAYQNFSVLDHELENGEAFNNHIKAKISSNVTNIVFIQKQDNESIWKNSYINVAANQDKDLIKLIVDGDTAFILADGPICTGNDTSKLFKDCKNCKTISLNNFYASYSSTMESFFENCSNLESVYFGNYFDTINVVNFSKMFKECINLEKIDLTMFSAPVAKNLAEMFYNCQKLVNINFPNDLQTQNVERFTSMFELCKSINLLSLDCIDTSSAQYVDKMFASCSKLNTVKLGERFITDKISSCDAMFSSCSSLTTIYAFNDFNIFSSSSANILFESCNNLIGGNGTKWDPANVGVEYAKIDREYVVGYFTSYIPKNAQLEDTSTFNKHITNIQTSSTDTLIIDSKVNHLDMWAKHSDISSYTRVGLTDKDDVRLFVDDNAIYVLSDGLIIPQNDCSGLLSGLSNIGEINMNNIDTSNVVTMKNLFKDCSNLYTLYFGEYFYTCKVENMDSMFENCSKLDLINFNSKFDTKSTKSMASMFNGCSSLTTINATDDFDTSNVIDFSNMFKECTMLSFDNIVKNLDTRNAIKLSYMFYACNNLSNIDVSTLNTQKCEDVSAMFGECKNLEDIDLSYFDTSLCQNFDSMFDNCISLKTISLGEKFSTANAISLNSMFKNCNSLKTIYSYNNFSVKSSSCTSLDMFDKCSNLIGGNGTKYDDIHKDISYAKLDGMDLPGYFSPLTQKCFTLQSGDELNSNLLLFNDASSIIFDSKANNLELWTATSNNNQFIHVGDSPSDDIRLISTDHKIYILADGVICSNANCDNMFSNLLSLSTIKFKNFNSLQADSMKAMFKDCKYLTNLEFSQTFVTDNVSNMSSMFEGCDLLENLNLTTFCTVNVKYFDEMFKNCATLKAVWVFSDFATDSLISDSDMFLNCRNIVGQMGTSYDDKFLNCDRAKIDMRTVPGYFSNDKSCIAALENGDTFNKHVREFENATEKIIFGYGSYYSELWQNYEDPKTYINVAEDKQTNLIKMFSDSDCLYVLANNTISFNADCSNMFNNLMHKSVAFENCDTCLVKYANSMFEKSAFSDLDLTKFNTVNVVNLEKFLFESSNLYEVNLGPEFNVKNVSTFDCMFSKCKNLSKIYSPYSFIIANSATTSNMFFDSTNIKGGCGTEYSQQCIDGSYARVDSSYVKGYFTEKTAAGSILVSGDKFRKYAKQCVGENEITDIVFGTKESYSKLWDTYDEPDKYIQVGLQDVDDIRMLYDNSKIYVLCNGTIYANKDLSKMFLNLNKLVNLDFSNFNTQNVCNMSKMFDGCVSLTNIDLSSFYADNVTSCELMFYNCQNIPSINLDSFNCKNLTNCNWMFAYCTNLKSVTSTQFATPKLLSTKCMFYECASLNDLDLNNFNSNNIDDCSQMFSHCESIKNIDTKYYLSNNLTNMNGLFQECYQLISLDLTCVDTSKVVDMSYTFYDCHNLESINFGSNFQTGSTKKMDFMFSQCSELTQIDLSHFNVENVVSLENLFMGCKKLSTIDLSYFYTSNLITTKNMFKDCTSLETLTLGDGFVTDSVELFDEMFSGCNKLKKIYSSWDFSNTKCKSCSNMFLNCLCLEGQNGTTYDPQHLGILYARIDKESNKGYFSEFDRGVAYLKSGPEINMYLNQGQTINNIYVSTKARFLDIWNNYSKTDQFVSVGKTVNDDIRLICTNDCAYILSGNQIYANEDSSAMFANISSCCNIDLYNIDTSEVRNLNSMFYNCCSLNTIKFNDRFTNDSVVDFSSMFKNCYNLESLDIGFWNVDMAETMDYMFAWCKALKSLQIPNCYTSKLKSMSYMFYECVSIDSISFSGLFNTDNVTDMSYMFYSCLSLKSLELDNFNTENTLDMKYMFTDCANLEVITLGKNFYCGRTQDMSFMFYGCKNLKTINAYTDFINKYGVKSYRMFYDCVSISGGNGTKYNSENTDIDYAKIDDFSQKGYFTKLTTKSVDIKSGPNLNEVFNSIEGLKQNTKKIIVSTKTSCLDIWNKYLYSYKHIGKTYDDDVRLICDNTDVYILSDGLISSDADCEQMFYDFKNVEFISCNNLSTQNATNMKEMFANDSNLVNIDLGAYFNTSNVTAFRSMFSSCNSLVTINGIDSFDTHCAKNFYSMFASCKSLKELNLSHFATSDATYFNSMFQGCSSLVNLDLSYFDTRNASTMSFMFSDCNSLQQITFGKQFQTNRVRDFRSMFKGCINLKCIYAYQSFNVGKASITENAFYGCYSLVGGNNTTYSEQCTSAEYARIDKANLKGYFTKIQDKDNYLIDSVAFNKIVKTYDKACKIAFSSREDNIDLWNAYDKDYLYTSVGIDDKSDIRLFLNNDIVYVLSDGNMIAPSNLDSMLKDLTNINSVSLGNLDTTNTESISCMFENDSSLQNIDFSSVNLQNVKCIDSVFYGCKSILNVDLSKLNFESVTSCSNMFKECSNLVSLDLSNNNLSNVENASSMFEQCARLTNVKFPTVNSFKSVKDMRSMFKDCPSLTDLNLTTFCTNNLVYVDYMFYGDKELNAIWFGQEFVTNQVVSMDYMFFNCANLVSIYAFNDFVSSTSTTSILMFEGDINIIGGNGTIYDASHVDAEYARIDNTINKGYFTRLDLQRNILEDGPSFSQDIKKEIKGIEIDNIIFAYADSYRDVWDSHKSSYKQVSENGHYDIRLIIEKDSAYVLAEGDIYTNLDCSYMFDNLSNVKSIKFENLIMNMSTNLTAMFNNCISLSTLDLGDNFNTQNVFYFSDMFNNCESLEALDLTDKFSVSKGENLSRMFAGCSKLKNADFLKEFNTQNARYFSGMFDKCSSLVEVDLSSFVTANSIYFDFMFSNCASLKILDLSNFNTFSVVTFESMLQNCSNVETVKFGPQFVTNNCNCFNNMFKNCTSLHTIGVYQDIVISYIGNSSDMFAGCVNLVGQNGTTYDQSNVNGKYARVDTTDNPGYFSFANANILENGSKLQQHLKTSSYYDTITFGSAFTYKNIWDSHSQAGQYVSVGYTSNDDIRLILDANIAYILSENMIFANPDCSDMFSGISCIKNIIFDNFYTSNTTNMANFFKDCTSLDSICFKLGFDTSNVKNMSAMFKNCSNLSSMDLAIFDLKNTTTLKEMFSGCSTLTNIVLPTKPSNNLEDISAMFMNCECLEQIVFSDGFSTFLCKDMSNMFNGCKSLTNIDLSTFNTASLEDSNEMFGGCVSLSQINLGSNFTLNSCIDATYMFKACTKLVSIYCAHDFSMPDGSFSQGMFQDCTSLVGGNGTAYNPDYVDNQYAKVDRDGTCGYFSSNQTMYNILETGASLNNDLLKMKSSFNFESILFGYKSQYENVWNSHISSQDYEPVDSSKSGIIRLIVQDSIAYILSDSPIQSNATSSSMFNNLTDIISVEFRNFYTFDTIDMSYMFKGCRSLNNVYFGENFWTQKVENLSSMFNGCSSLEYIYLPSTFDTSHVLYALDMFSGCINLFKIFAYTDFNTSSLKAGVNMFFGCRRLVGANGTQYDVKHSDYKYARIDTLDKPGYFSYY